MPRRIDIELTSKRDESTWTWRAAGAKQPKGTLDSSLLPEGSGVGDVLKVDVETDVDGILVVGVGSSRARKSGPETIEIIGSGRSEGGVTTNYVERKGKGGRDGRGGKGGRGRDEKRGGKESRDGRDKRSGRGDSRHGGRSSEQHSERPEDNRPKPKRLRPGRKHRDALVAALPPEEQPIAEQVVRGGIPAVRKAIDEQNERARKEGLPEVNGEPLITIAERLVPKVHSAEWRDRADSALVLVDELDLRDLRSVVVAADDAAKDVEARELAQQLRTALTSRVESEHQKWLDEIRSTLAEGRVVRALRLSSRPPKAGSPLPTDLATDLTQKAGEALGAEISQQRWGTVIDALAFSPVRNGVHPAAYPKEPGEELTGMLKKGASQLPEIAAHYGIKATRRRRGGAKRSSASAAKTDSSGKPIPQRPTKRAQTEAKKPAKPAEPVTAEPVDDKQKSEADTAEATTADSAADALPSAVAPASE
ncbi:MAG: hypothetical protein ACC652_05560 [Acidimicrobiales bacterium]